MLALGLRKLSGPFEFIGVRSVSLMVRGVRSPFVVVQLQVGVGRLLVHASAGTAQEGRLVEARSGCLLRSSRHVLLHLLLLEEALDLVYVFEY